MVNLDKRGPARRIVGEFQLAELAAGRRGRDGPIATKLAHQPTGEDRLSRDEAFLIAVNIAKLPTCRGRY
jgi:hypothetical protein